MTDLQAIADRVEIEALRGEFTDAAMMRDRARLASLFTPGGVLRMPIADWADSGTYPVSFMCAWLEVHVLVIMPGEARSHRSGRKTRRPVMVMLRLVRVHVRSMPVFGYSVRRLLQLKDAAQQRSLPWGCHSDCRRDPGLRQRFPRGRRWKSHRGSGLRRVLSLGTARHRLCPCPWTGRSLRGSF